MEGPLSPDKNPLFSNPVTIPVSYWERLKADYYQFNFFGFDGVARKEDKKIFIDNFPIRLSFQIYLVILTYLYVKESKNILLGKDWVLARELKGGIHFFDRSHPIDVKRILDYYHNDLVAIKRKALKYKGNELNLGDFGYDFMVFPEIKIRYIFYEGDEDFPSYISVIFQKGIEDYLPLDVIWAITNIIGDLFCL